MSVMLQEPAIGAPAVKLPQMMGRVLFICYHFPPVGGAGVQRPAKFVKYLRQYGWEASVVMAANPSVPVFDESLCADLPDDLIVEKARTWEPGYRFKNRLSPGENTGAMSRQSQSNSLRGLGRWLLRQTLRGTAGMLLQPDPQVLWLPSAFRAASRLLKRVPHDAIFATAPPYSNLLLGGRLKRRFRLPLVLDYRDEWDLSSQYLENHPRDWLSRMVQPRMQRRVLRHADAVVATTRASARRLQARIREAGGTADAYCIYNGFDPADFGAEYAPVDSRTIPTAAYAPHERFRLVYTGTLWNLTDVEPVVRAIELLCNSEPQLLPRLELHFVGRKTAEQRQTLDRLSKTGCRLILEDYCDHRRALEIMQSADALLLLLSDVDGADRVVPAKLFEYLALRKEILTVAPCGETAEIVKNFFPTGQLPPGNSAGITQWLSTRLHALGQRQQSKATTPLSPWERGREEGPSAMVRSYETHLARFTRQHQAGQLAELLDRITGRPA
jgi:glycosyltransferase involved in cell wall biosynthesis